MGSALSGIAQAVRQKIDQNHAEQQQRDSELRNHLWSVFTNPQELPSVRAEAQERLSKLYPDQKKPIGKFGEFFDRVTDAFNGVQHQDSAQGSVPVQGAALKLAEPSTGVPSSAQAAQGQSPGTAAVSQLASPKTPAPNTSMIPSAPTAEQIQAAQDVQRQHEYDFWLQRGKEVLGPDANPRDLAEYAGSKGQRLPTQQKRVSDKGVARPGIDPATNQPYTGTWDHVVEPDGTETWAKRDEKLVNQQKEWVHFPGDPEDILHEVWADPRHPGKRVDERGNPVPEGSTSVNPTVASAKLRGAFWGRFGQEYQSALAQGYSEQDAKRIAGQKTDAYLDKQYATLGATRIHEVLGLDNEGNQVAVPLTSSIVPSGPPAPQSAPPVPSPSPSATSPASAAVAPPPAPAPKSSAVPAVTPKPSALSTRKLDAVAPSQARQAAQFAIPITESVVQMFGDPSQPDIKPMASFAHLADDPEASKRIGKAIQLTMSGFGDGIGTASIGAGAGPVHLSAGGFGDWIQNALNVPGAVAQQKADIIRKAISDLTPEEREAYDATMAELSVMAGLRSLNKSSAAQGSIRLIENEIPKIGINTANSKQFYDQLQKIAGAISNAMNTPGAVPKVKDVPFGVTPEMFSRIKGLSSEIQKKKDAASVSPRGKASLKAPSAAPKNADQYLHSIGVQ